jgi:hypothetical protein
MPGFVYDLPTWLAGAIVIGAWTLLAAGGVRLARPLVQSRLRERHHEVIVPLFTTVATMYAIVVAFMVVVVWQRYSDADTNSQQESTLLVTMYRETLGMPEPLAGSLRADIRAYTGAVIDQELPAQRRGEQSDAAGPPLDRLFRLPLERTPQESDLPEVYPQFLANASTLAQLRADRLLSSRSRLPDILVFGLVAGGLLTIGNSTLLIMQQRAMQAVAAGLAGAMIGLLLFLIAVLGLGYAGGAAVGPADYEYAVTAFQSVDATR